MAASLKSEIETDLSGPVVVLGAGAIGLFVGGHWAAKGVPVVFLGRKARLEELARSGLRLSGAGRALPLGALQMTDDAAVLTGAGMVVVAVKATGLAGAIEDIRAHLPPGVAVVSLLNGVGPSVALADALPDHPVIAGMVPFNVVWDGPGHLKRSGAGQVTLARAPASALLAERVLGSGVPVTVGADIRAVQYGKLLLNLNNPINALSGKTLFAELCGGGYREIFARAVEEAMQVYAAAGIRPAQVGPTAPEKAVRVLRWPDFLFRHIVLRVQGITRGSMTSMASDLASGRETEIDAINGEIVRLAERLGVDAPVNAGLVRLIKAAEAGGQATYSEAALMEALVLA